MDKGPWFVFHGRKPEQKLLGVQSEDFTHDVWLEVHGDFGPPEDKLAYCEWLAKRLNEEARIAELEAESALEKKRNRELEAENLSFARECNLVADEKRALEKRVAELEVENQRLRDAAQAVVDSATPHYDRWVNGVTRVCINRLAALLGGGENG